ncbi:MAG: ABC transporter ATP-binding protein, partial [Bacteroidota bacterium]
MGKEKPQKGLTLFSRIIKFVRPFTGLMLAAFFLNTLFSIFSAATIAIIKPVMQLLFDVEEETAAIENVDFFTGLKQSFFDLISSLISAESMEYSLLKLSLLIVVLFIFKNIFKYFGAIASIKFEQGIAKSIRDQVFEKMTSLSVDFFSKTKSGTLISIITNDISTINTTTLSSFNTVIREATQIIIFLFILFAISMQLTLIAFSTSLISLVLIRISVKYLKRYAGRMQTAMAEYTSTLQETISGIRVVKAYNAESSSNNRFFEDTKRFVTSAVKHRKIVTLIPGFNEIFAITALCVVLMVGGSFVLQGVMTPDDLMLFLFTLFAIMSPVASLINNFSKYQHGLVAAERVFKILDSEPAVKTGLENIRNFNKDIKIENLSFAYDNECVLKDINLKIEKGKRIAFVGASGSGKSTMLDLIIRFYDPDSGAIYIDGRDI